MRSFADYNPLVLLLYFLAVTLVAMFGANPVLSALSLAGALTLYLLLRRGGGGALHGWCAALFVLTALVNPLVNHNGVTVLFVMNNNPVTREALWYGVAAAAMLAAVLYWFASFSWVMTGDRLLYLLGSAVPKLSLILSMALRYVPLFAATAKKVNAAQRGLGLYRDDTLPDTLRGGARVLSILVTWALENGVTTAESMEARGYGATRRSFFARYGFRRGDGLLLALTLALLLPTLVLIAGGAVTFSFYPAVQPPSGGGAAAAYLCYGLLCFLPAILQTAEEIQWTYLLSKI